MPTPEDDQCDYSTPRGTPCALERAEGSSFCPKHTTPPYEGQIDHPSHYGGDNNPYETILVIEAAGWGEGFVKGNALKYLMRAGKKDSEPEDKDMEKVVWYAERRIKQIRGEV